MKSIIQIFLFALIIVVSFLFYKSYFVISKNDIEVQIKDIVISEDKTTDDAKKNNIIQNLQYQVELIDGTNYKIISELSEISYVGRFEIVSMQKVTATIIDKKNKMMTIKSDNALYNKLTYSTEFKNNVIINYLDNTISSEMLNFNLKENNILISKNVIYKSNSGIVKADNILIDLTTKNVEIFMNSGEKIQVTSKE